MDIETTTTPVVRSSAGLRDALFDELDGLRNGSSNPARANAVAKIANQVIDTVKMELEVQKHMQKKTEENPKASQLPPPVQLSAS